MDNRKLWYAVMLDDQDSDWGYGAESLEEAIEMVRTRRDLYPGAYIAVIDDSTDNPICIDIIRDI